MHVLVAAGRRYDGLERYKIDLAMSHATLCHQGIGKTPDVLQGATQDHRLHAFVVVQVDMHAGDGEIVMRVLERRETTRQFTLMMVVHITHRSDAGLWFRAFQSFLLKTITNQIAHGLGAMLVTVTTGEVIKGLGEGIVDRNGQSLHGEGRQLDTQIIAFPARRRSGSAGLRVLSLLA